MNWLTGNVLNYSYDSRSHLQTNFYPQINLTRTLVVSSAQVRVDPADVVTEVSLKVESAPLERLEFRFPLVDSSFVAEVLSEKLGLPNGTIDKLIRN